MDQVKPLKVEIGIGKGYMPDFSPEDIGTAQGMKVANNIVRSSGYFWPIPGKRIFNSTALSGTPNTGINVQSGSGDKHNFAGTSTKLYAFDGTNMTDITRASGAYTGGTWNFCPYGDWLVATNYTDAIQIHKDIGHATTGTKFTDLSGADSAGIKARYALIVQGHLVLAGLIEGGVVAPKKVRWSALENIEDWTKSVSTGADSQEFPDMDGIVTGIASVGKEWAVFSENSITPAYFMGGQYVFGFNSVAIKNIGCAFPRTLISIGETCYFWSRKSIYKLTTAGAVEIGMGLKNALFAELNANAADKITTTHDPSKSLIYWHYPTGGSLSTIPASRMLILNYQEGVFTTADVSGFFSMMGYSGSTLVDSISDPVDTINDYARAVDSPYWKGNADALMVCDDTEQTIQSLTGPMTTGVIETGEINAGETMVAITKFQVPIEGTSVSATIQVNSRYSSVSPTVSSVIAPIRTDSTADIRITNRRFSASLQLANYERIGNSISTDAVSAGGR